MRGSPRDFAHRPLPSMIMAMWRGTVLVLTDISAVVTVGSCERKANVAVLAIAAVASAVLSGVLAAGGSALRTAHATAHFRQATTSDSQTYRLPARWTDAHHCVFCYGEHR